MKNVVQQIPEGNFVINERVSSLKIGIFLLKCTAWITIFRCKNAPNVCLTIFLCSCCSFPLFTVQSLLNYPHLHFDLIVDPTIWISLCLVLLQRHRYSLVRLELEISLMILFDILFKIMHRAINRIENVKSQIQIFDWFAPDFFRIRKTIQ